MNVELARDEIRAAAKWWRDLIVRLQAETSYTIGLFAMLPEHAPIRPERADAFETALVAEIEATFEQDCVIWDAASPLSGSSRRILEVVGQRPPSEVCRAADFAGLAHALRHLKDAASTTINPGSVKAYGGRKSRNQEKVETIVVAATKGGRS